MSHFSVQTIEDRFMALEDRAREDKKRIKELEGLVTILEARTSGMMDQIADQKAQIALLADLLRRPALCAVTRMAP